jgi:hypothetical protein
MAFDLTGLTAYVEDMDYPLIAQAQASGGVAQIQGVNIQTGIKGSSNIQLFSTDLVFQPDGCGRTASGTTDLVNRTITVGKIMVAEDLCPKALNGFWTQQMVRRGTMGETELPTEIEGLWIEDKMNRLKRQLSISDWQGDTASATNNLSYYDGLIKLIDAETTVNGNPNGITVATGITEANVISILQDIWKLIPENVIGLEDVSIYVGTDVYRLYVNALINANLFHYVGEDGITKLHGTNVKLVSDIGLTGTDRIFATRDGNIYIGMDGEDGEDELNVRYSEDDRVVKFTMSFKRGVQIAYPDEIVEFTLVP